MHFAFQFTLVVSAVLSFLGTDLSAHPGRAGLLFCGFFALSFFRSPKTLFLSGLFLPLTSFVGGLPFALSAFLLGERRVPVPPRAFASGTFLVGAFFLPCALTWWKVSDLSIVTDLLTLGGIASLGENWKLFSFLRALSLLILVFVSLVFAGSFRRFESEEKRRFLEGLSSTMLLSSLAALLQFFEIPWAPSRAEFWRSLGRASGLFSDPNAFGVVSVLALYSSFLLPRKERLLFVPFILLGGLLSGSRTFILGLLLLLFRCDPKVRIPVLLAMCAGGALLLIPSVNSALVSLSPFPSLDRALMTIHPEKMREMFFSRSVYSEIALNVFSSAPLLGVGLEEFYAAQTRAMSELGIQLSGWLDNANNFYLQLLAEGGVVSLFCLASAIFLARGAFLRGESFGLSAFLLLLLTGPHHLFPEVMLFAALQVGSSLGEFKPSPNRRFPLVLIGGVLLCSVLIHTRVQTRGVYPADSPYEPELRWTSKEVSLRFCAPKPGQTFSIRSQYPRLVRRPQVLEYRDGSTLSLTDTDWHQLPVPETGELSFRVTPAFQPEKRDSRWLGVQIRTGEPLC